MSSVAVVTLDNRSGDNTLIMGSIVRYSLFGEASLIIITPLKITFEKVSTVSRRPMTSIIFTISFPIGEDGKTNTKKKRKQLNKLDEDASARHSRLRRRIFCGRDRILNIMLDHDSNIIGRCGLQLMTKARHVQPIERKMGNSIEKTPHKDDSNN